MCDVLKGIAGWPSRLSSPMACACGHKAIPCFWLSPDSFIRRAAGATVARGHASSQNAAPIGSLNR
jgi:hypothetical protein